MKAEIRSMSGAVLLGMAQWAWALQVPGPVVDGDWLAANRTVVTVLDVRPNLKSFLTAPRFETDAKTGNKILAELGGHIPGASPVQNSSIRAERTFGSLKVKFMLPERSEFEKLARGWGVQAGRPIVIAAAGRDPQDFNAAARLYWQFKVFGEDNIAIVNGGTAAWIAEGREVAVAPTKLAAGDWVAKAERTELIATSQDVEAAIATDTAQLVDARSTPEYFGLTKKSTVSGYGHIAGAKNVSSELLTTEGNATRMRSAATYRDIYKASGIDPHLPAITYCNTGVLAAGNWFVLSEILGNNRVRLYDGSLHKWTLEGRPLRAVAPL
ncbi:MAG: sulfurtransferase [Ramlibacter sp.]